MRRAITFEHLVYILILFLSLGLRFALLGSLPLNDREASLALQAWSVSQGTIPTLSGEPGYLALTSILFFMFGSSEFFARFWPALFGSSVVVLPYLFKDLIGKRTSLVLAFFLALDPVLVSTSRSAGGGMIGLVAILAGLGFWIKNKKILSGICFGLAFLGGTDFWPGILIIGLALLISTRMSLPVKNDQTNESTPNHGIKVVLYTGIVTILVICTLFLIIPEGISTFGSSLVEYFRSWGSGIETPFYLAGLLWLITQLPGILLGVWGAVNRKTLGLPYRRFLLYWWIGAFLLVTLNPSRNLYEIFWFSIPMWVFGAAQLVDLFDNTYVDSKVVLLAQAAATIAFILFSTLNLIYLINSAGLDEISTRNRLIGAILPLVLLIVFTILMAWGWSDNSARKGLLIGLGTLLMISYIGTSWKAAGLGSNPENEILGGQAYPVGYRYYLASISDLSKWKNGQSNAIDIQLVDINSPALDWAFRDFKALGKTTVFNPNTTPSVVITTSENEIQSLAIYRGQKLLWSVRPQIQSMSLKDWMKWGFLRKVPLQKTEYLLWARNDLFAGSTTKNQE